MRPEKKIGLFATLFIEIIEMDAFRSPIDVQKSIEAYLKSILNKDSMDYLLKSAKSGHFWPDDLSYKDIDDYLVKVIEYIQEHYTTLARNSADWKKMPVTLFRYYAKTLKDPVRVFSYVSGLHQLFLQDVETCIQNADIFIRNRPDTPEKPRLNQSLIRYISLMIHPGLVLPTPVERCMQIAFTAKVNSGCISRQVGAVVTDKNYNILSLGWNDVPIGQLPCIQRNIIDASHSLDQEAYSDYEKSPNKDFYPFLRDLNIDCDRTPEFLEGLPFAYCFKDIHEEITGEKNPMDSRAMHGEEKALLLCDQKQVKSGYLFTTSSPCEMCAKNAKEHEISIIYYIEPYPGISQSHVSNSGDTCNQAKYELFEGAIGRAYTQLYTPIIPLKDELSLRGTYYLRQKSCK